MTSQYFLFLTILVWKPVWCLYKNILIKKNLNKKKTFIVFFYVDLVRFYFLRLLFSVKYIRLTFQYYCRTFCFIRFWNQRYLHLKHGKLIGLSDTQWLWNAAESYKIRDICCILKKELELKKDTKSYILWWKTCLLCLIGMH